MERIAKKATKAVREARSAARRSITLHNLNKRLKNCESNIRAEETKRYVTEYSEEGVQTILTTGTTQVINDMVRGDLARNLDGSQYSLTGIGYRFLVHNQGAVDCIYRMCLVRIDTGSALTTTGESLFMQSNGDGLNFSSATESQKYYLPLNRRKYDVIFERSFKVGKSNATYTSQYNNNFIIKGYRRFKNKKETLNSNGVPDTKYQLLMWAIDANLDGNIVTLEQSGQTVFYYKDN